MPIKRGIKSVASNRRAFHDYFILERMEAGIALAGTEVKSIRLGQLNLKDSFCFVRDGEMYVHGMHISPYEKGNIFNKDPVRERKLLLHKREILKLYNAVKRDGCTVVPLEVYLKDSRVKVEIGLAKGKKLYDKREDESKRDANREMARSHAGRGFED
ncbi:MAG: SsrA-binding protein SmpB [Clostridiaceae bacterium]|nr:SsrA-binding protein SmpB [Clostridiaceae bacterium]